MNIFLQQDPSASLRLFADCRPVKGATRSAVYDLTRGELVLFGSEYFEVLEYLISDTVGNVLAGLENEEERTLVLGFVDFLYSEELIFFTREPERFPEIECRWEMPGMIQNAIIDVDLQLHDFGKIFSELDALGCPFVQIRAFSCLLTPNLLDAILPLALHKTIAGIELLLLHDPQIPDERYITLIETHPIINQLTLHSATEERTLVVDYGLDEERSRYIKKEIPLVTEKITAHTHCGIIHTGSLNQPMVPTFFENQLFNGCLNRKISVDVHGEIRNCPSMASSYGNILHHTLPQALDAAGFTEVWNITKDQISVCRDCEFRYACTDCRAYLENPANALSKPLKCGYNPYTAEWEDWSENPAKQEIFRQYLSAQPKPTLTL